MTVKKKMTLLSLSLISLFIITGFFQVRSVKNIAGNWKTYQQTALQRQILLTEIMSQFGYGGFIHNFKNHVLRGTNKYVDRFMKNKAGMDKAFASYKKLDLSSEERTALADIEAVAEKYTKAVETSKDLHKKGLSPMEIDGVVKISDGPAFKGFKVLDEHVKSLEKAAGDSLNSTIKAIYTLMVITGIAMLLFFGLFFKVLLSFAGRLSILQKATVEIGRGNFSTSVRVDGNDEIGAIGGALVEMSDKLCGVIQKIQEQTTVLNKSSATLSVVSGDLMDGTANASDQADSVAAATEEMSANMNSVAAASEEASASVVLVSNAIEEILASVEEEAKQTTKAQDITRHAVTLAASSSEKVDALGTAAAEISKVTEVITEISEQTNLLALNATIEAARAGEAGKGFAVVANEIKELAKQTAEATGEIKNKIGSIQMSTNETVDEIKQISSVINEVDGIVAEIAMAVEEQSATSGGISQNITQAAEGITEVSENVAQSSTVSSEIAENIAETSAVVSKLSGSGAEIERTAQDLVGQVTILKELTDSLQGG